MAFDSPRIAELRRRVQADPSSIAFAQLAEEHRRGGNYEEAVRVCRAGLERHPGYLSARVTLGRALMELGQLDEAEVEFDLVLGTAADNLAAIRGVAEIHQRRGDLQSALGFYQSALALARHDPDLEETVAQISRSLAEARPAPDTGLSFEQLKDELESAADRMAQGLPAESIESAPDSETPGAPVAVEPPALSVDVAPPVADEPAAVFEVSQPAANAAADSGEAMRAAMDALAPAESPASSTAPAVPADAPALFDFDGLLEALGQPASIPAPPQVEAWIPPAPTAVDEAADLFAEALSAAVAEPAREDTASAVPSAEEAALLPDGALMAAESLDAMSVGTTVAVEAAALPIPAKAGDILGQIEEDLRQLEADAPTDGAQAAIGAAASALAPADQAALDELERWLEVLEDARASSRAADAATSSTTRA